MAALLLRNVARKTLCRTGFQWSEVSVAASVSNSAYKPGENFFEKNERLKRPMSPHITIYKFQLPAIMSITHRGTGLLMTAGVYGLGIYGLLKSGNYPQLMESLQGLHMSNATIWVAKYAVAWPFVYHGLNGIRHLFWDMGLGFEMSTLYKSGYLVTMLSILLTFYLASI